VNAANERMLGGGGVDGAIHREAGKALVEACRQVPEVRAGVRCPTGEARITPGFGLPSRHVIHTVGPVYSQHSRETAAALLGACYRSTAALALENGLARVAWPAISCGVYGYPLAEAAEVSLAALAEANAGSLALSEVHFVLFGKETLAAWASAAERAGLPPAA